MATTDRLEINLLTVCNFGQPISRLVRWAWSFVGSHLSTYLLTLGLVFKCGLISNLSNCHQTNMCWGERSSNLIRNEICHKHLFLINYKNYSLFSFSVHCIITMAHCELVGPTRWLSRTDLSGHTPSKAWRFQLQKKIHCRNCSCLGVSCWYPTWESVRWASRPQRRKRWTLGRAEVDVVIEDTNGDRHPMLRSCTVRAPAGRSEEPCVPSES